MNILNLNLRMRLIVGISISILIALIHVFRVGSYLSGDLYIYYYSYVSDLIIPFGCYFLLCINEVHLRFLQKWYVKAFLIFGITSFTEIMQAFGIYFLGVTFDPIDILMFGTGVMIAVLVDQQIFDRIIPHWKMDEKNTST